MILLFGVVLAVLSCVDVNYTDPSDWGNLCETGDFQSPIDLTSGVPFNHFVFTSYQVLKNLTSFNCPASYSIPLANSIVYLKNPAGNTIVCNAVNAFFHSPSEHTINGQSFDLELQVYHTVPGGVYQNVVLSYFFEITEENNNFFDQFISESQLLDVVPVFDLSSILGNLASFYNYFMYVGSLTTPPCTENILWYVFSTPGNISSTQLDAFQNKWKNNSSFAQGKGNNRPTQSGQNIKVYSRS